MEGVSYLADRGLRELLAAEREGTRIALTGAGRPNRTITLPRVDAHAVGQYLFLMELAVALMGELYDVNADPRQERDVADEHPQLVKRFEQRIQRWIAAMVRPESAPSRAR